jgi:hypothetical protein
LVPQRNEHNGSSTTPPTLVTQQQINKN